MRREGWKEAGEEEGEGGWKEGKVVVCITSRSLFRVSS